MRVALAHNLRQADARIEPGYTSRATVEALAHAIAAGGHDVTPVEVSSSLGAITARLQSAKPDLVFTIAEGQRGGWRQPLYPAIYDDLAIPYTGSDAHALSITLDKRLTKLIAESVGARTPAWRFIRHPRELDLAGLRMPVIVKPNFEGWSTGITSSAIAVAAAEARAIATTACTRFPDGVLVEEFIAGRDLTVPFLEAVDNDWGGVLTPAEYVHPADPANVHGIYDFELKNARDHTVTARVPAAVSAAVMADARTATRRLLHAIGCRDIARADFRLGADDTLYLLEVNAAPNLQPGGSVHLAAALDGLHPSTGAVAAIISTASSRHGLC